MSTIHVRGILIALAAMLVFVGFYPAATPTDPLAYRVRPMTADERAALKQGIGEEPEIVGLEVPEQQLIEQALGRVQARFRAEHVRQNMFGTARRWWVEPSYWAKIGLAEDDAPKIGMGLLGMQIYYLGHNRFPPINIVPYWSRIDTAVGRGPIGCVVTKYGGRTADDVTGEFVVLINVRVMRERRDLFAPDIWAGTITHEMLHNLGHMHGDGDYKDDLQINTFAQCVRTNGKFRGGDPCPHFKCGR